MSSPLEFARLAVLVFFAICFLQAGLDKAFDWKGNLEYFRGHFSKTVLGPFAGLLLPGLALLELLTGAVCLAGAAMLSLRSDALLAHLGVMLSLLSLLVLFSGQRLAKDYAGAASIAGYFAVALLGAVLFAI